jgi:hypothetical protein
MVIRSLEHYAALITDPRYAFYYPVHLGYYRLFIPWWGGYMPDDYDRTLYQLRG